MLLSARLPGCMCWWTMTRPPQITSPASSGVRGNLLAAAWQTVPSHQPGRPLLPAWRVRFPVVSAPSSCHVAPPHATPPHRMPQASTRPPPPPAPAVRPTWRPRSSPCPPPRSGHPFGSLRPHPLSHVRMGWPFGSYRCTGAAAGHFLAHQPLAAPAASCLSP